MRVIRAVVGMVLFMLALRFILLFLGASASAPIVEWVYRVTDGVVAPFAGAFGGWALPPFAIDFSTLFAMIGYALLGWVLIALVRFFMLPR